MIDREQRLRRKTMEIKEQSYLAVPHFLVSSLESYKIASSSSLAYLEFKTSPSQ